MPKPPIDRERFIGRWLFATFAVLASILTAAILWDIHSGVAHTKTGSIFRARDPQGFWIEIVIDAGVVLLFAFLAVRFRRYARKTSSPPSE